MTHNEVWQQLLSLESRDAVTRWFDELHGLELNARRAKEITAAAKQAREYFRNAAESAYSVRPLLTFYGVASLSRSLVLLLRPNGGEETLTAGHGLETVNWSGVISGDLGTALKSVPALKIRTTAGLFSELVKQTNNRVPMHINSAAVDWSICHDAPQTGIELTMGEILSRTPDVHSDYEAAGGQAAYAPVIEMTCSQQDGWRAKVPTVSFSAVKEFFAEFGYIVTEAGGTTSLSADTKTFCARTPLFVHCYIQKTFGTIPRLHLARPFGSDIAFSQLTLTYMLGYILGMLVRYYPTHWIALSQGEKGDVWWPTLNRTQHLVENAFPELVIELIHDLLKEAKNKQVHA